MYRQQLKCMHSYSKTISGSASNNKEIYPRHNPKQDFSRTQTKAKPGNLSARLNIELSMNAI